MHFLEILQVLSLIVGIIVSVIAVIISLLALKQTQRSIEQANRPYVVVYRDYIQVLGNVQEHIIVKNFGKSGAVIDSLDFKPNYTDTRGKKTFENIADTFVAPNQAISTVTSHNAFAENRKGVTDVTISYHNGD